MKKLIFIAGLFLPVMAMAAPLSITSKVKSVSFVGRPGADYGGLQVALQDPITGTSCAAADVAKGFYTSSGTAVQAAIMVQAYASQALAAQAQDIPMTFNYDSTTGCVPGYGIGWPVTPVTLQTPAP